MSQVDLKQAAQQQLEKAGVPVNLAAQAAEVVAKDDPRQPNLGRSEADQHIIRSAYAWMKAKSE